MHPNWQNRTMWTGDNLEIMRGMNSESVDLIYLDPPFNSNRTYSAPIGSEAAGAAFKDTWTLDDVDLAWHGEIAEREPALYAVIDAAGQAHSKGMMAYVIMMAVRLLEMRRLLKPTGSIYLHCDPTACHYLKLVMDTVFGPTRFRTDIAWRRATAHSDTKQGRRQHGRVHDVLLYYTRGENWTWNPVYTEYDRAYVDSFYRHREPDGRRYRKDNLTAARPGGDTSYEWHVKRPEGGEWEADLTDEWMTPLSGWEYRGVPPYNGRFWAYSQEKMRGFAASNRLAYASTGMPTYKRYLDEMPGVPLQDLWTDITNTSGKERIGYPTQKPLALLDRIIKASSDEGDMILDPFCGCATACVAADRLGRQWVGIDLSPLAADLVERRVQGEGALLFKAIRRTDIPKRTDVASLPNYRTHKHTLYGKQEGNCTGCRTHFPFRNLTIDHVVAQAKGGTDHLDNLQLLCGACNSMKGTGTQEELIAKLVAEGIRAA